MRHGLPSAFVALGLIMTTPAWAVSVGDIRPLSAIGEPLVVDIAVVESDGIADASIQITPATAADHALLGMERPAWLDQISFTTLRDDTNQLIVRATAPIQPTTSAQNFLVKLSWPGHVRLQQVSVDLSAESTSASKAAIAEPLTIEPAVEQKPVVTKPAVAANIPVPIVERPTQSPDGTLALRRGDTLSQIASEWDQNLSLNQRQQIIHKANPKAFIDGNINKLRADVSIRLPDLDSVDVPSESDANRWYRQALQKAKRLSTPVVVTAPEEDTPKEEADEANLTLVAPGKEGDGASEAEGDSADVADALADAQAERSSLLEKRLQLQDRLAQLNQENADADKRLVMLDERLAAMTSGEPVSSDLPVVADEADAMPNEEANKELNNTWIWWLLAIIFWMFLFVVWLRQRVQGQRADAENARTEPALDSDAEPEAPVENEDDLEQEPELEDKPEFDDTFADFAPGAAALGAHDEPAEDDEYDFLSDSDAEAYQTRLDLAQAYLDMNETDAARELLNRVLEGGTSEQRARAQALIDELA